MEDKPKLKDRSQWDESMLPDNVKIGSNLLPYVKNRIYGYGKRFNAFYTGNSNCYHTSRCHRFRNSKRKKIMHRYEAINRNLTPCSICHPKSYIDSWYNEFLKVNSVDGDTTNPQSIEKPTYVNAPQKNVFKTLFIITLLILICIIVFFVHSESNDKKDTSKQTKQYDTLLTECENYKTKNNELENRLEEKEAKIIELSAEVLIKNDIIDFYEKTTNTSGGVVYYTKNGSKYHTPLCNSLNDPVFRMAKSDAIKSGYTPCSKCYN